MTRQFRWDSGVGLLGLLLLSGKVKTALDDYMARLDAGEITPTRD